MTWKAFRQLVNQHVLKMTGGLGLQDLADVLIDDFYPGQDGFDYHWDSLAEEAAYHVLEENGFPMDDEEGFEEYLLLHLD
tara:strand:- start:88 stop:327 length:240 start_codon:yes stop_codon:yes gene_type:complete